MSPEDLGFSLKERGVDVQIVDGQELVVRWFHSPHDCDLMVGCVSARDISRFQLNVCGQIVDWRRERGFLTGIIVVVETDPASRLMDVEKVQYDAKPNAQTLRSAAALIESMPALDPDLKSQVLQILRAPVVVCPVVRKNVPVAAQAAPRPRFWARLRLWGN